MAIVIQYLNNKKYSTKTLLMNITGKCKCLRGSLVVNPHQIGNLDFKRMRYVKQLQRRGIESHGPVAEDGIDD